MRQYYIIATKEWYENEDGSWSSINEWSDETGFEIDSSDIVEIIDTDKHGHPTKALCKISESQAKAFEPFDYVDAHLHHLKHSEDYANACQMITQDKSIYIEAKVTNHIMTPQLYNILYNQLQVAGLTIDCLHFSTKSIIEDFANKCHEFINNELNKID